MKSVGIGTLLLIGLLKILALIATGFFLAIGFSCGYDSINKYKKWKGNKKADDIISEDKFYNVVRGMTEAEKSNGTPRH